MVSWESRPNAIVVVCVTTVRVCVCGEVAVFAHGNLRNMALRPTELQLECDYMYLQCGTVLSLF